MPEIRSGEDLERWFESKPDDWAQAIAARAALRALPLTFHVLDVRARLLGRTVPRVIILQSFRATFVAWVAAKYPAQEMKNASIAAASAASSISASVTAGTANEAYSPLAAAAVAAAVAAAYSVASSSSSAAVAAASAAAAEGAPDSSDAWDAVAADCAWLEVHTEYRRLIDQPLWLVNARGNERYLANLPLDAFANSGMAETAWRLILDWYRAILPDEFVATPQSLFGEMADIAIATQPDEFWTVTQKRNPDLIMDDVAEIARGRIPEPRREPPNPTPPHRVRADLPPINDAVDGSEDFLNRADIAYALAGRLNEIWDQMNPQEGDIGHRPGRIDELRPGFVVHIDAPWGGGKTTFAEYLVQILNPYRFEGELPEWLKNLPLQDEKSWRIEFRRPWHIVRFNAWQHQHVSPPWWVFYETIRSTCTEALACETNRRHSAEVPLPAAIYAYPDRLGRSAIWLELTLRELLWRLVTPGFLLTLLLGGSTICALWLLAHFGILALDPSKPKEVVVGGDLPGFAVAALVSLIGGGATLHSLFRALASSLVPGTPDAAKNYSMGSGDPLARMRKHFVAVAERVRRPVLVVVDDLDRCQPEFVTELVRGMQTILASPRIVYVLLGDRDWIEQAFADVNKSMKEINVGPEHGFGGRFVEKAIQFSMVLPDMDEETRIEFVRNLLAPQRSLRKKQAVSAAPDAINAAEAMAAAVHDDTTKVLESLRKRSEDVLAIENFREREEAARRLAGGPELATLGPQKRRFERQMAQKLFYRAVSDETASEGTGHMLEGLAPVLPANPRQIKRIINALSLIQQIMRLKDPAKGPGTQDWQVLARWIVLMTEWPKSWYTLSKYPGLADKALRTDVGGELPDQDAEGLAERIRQTDEVMAILAFEAPDWAKRDIGSREIRWLREIVPPTSGKLLAPLVSS